MARLEDYAYQPAVPNTGDFLTDMLAMDKKVAEESAAALLNYRETGSITGCFWSHPVADNYATYRVSSARPLTLQHVAIGDAYAVPAAHIRGLNAADIKEALDWKMRWAALP